MLPVDGAAVTARKLGRTILAIRIRAHRTGAKAVRRRCWSPAERDALYQAMLDRVEARVLAVQFPGRSPGAVAVQAHRMRRGHGLTVGQRRALERAIRRI